MAQQSQTIHRCTERGHERKAVSAKGRADEQRAEPMAVSEVRLTVAQLARQEDVAEARVEAARDAFWNICRRGREYGLTHADVVRAILRPAFQRRRGCDCPSCKARRGDTLHADASSDPTPVEEGGEAKNALG